MVKGNADGRGPATSDMTMVCTAVGSTPRLSRPDNQTHSSGDCCMMMIVSDLVACMYNGI